ncbi:proteasome accessory factor PafA2 family protein [Haloferula sp. A504]|uniref:proteasome accessory factor PafA2 family protein n=1 Tax=Haloferula sp. A504 TaxID=3373601 RepID=UPI0031C283DF|nr:proteasome accessory factor PafA2 family protein [Verrucomicrobiaceae bacterium E54]
MGLWFGSEWEIAVSAITRNGRIASLPRLLDRIDAEVVRRLRHVDGIGNGWWLESAGRFYRDASEGGHAHNEYASPECDHPDELLRQDLAADRMMAKLAERVAVDQRYKEVRVSKANVSLASGESWGSHENYEARKPVLPKPMMGWLASRILMTGSGGLDVTYPGIRFTLSPRAHFIKGQVNAQTQSGRGLHNIGKAAALGKWHRVHVIAGDGNRAPLSTWLRFASTALVVRMLDSGRYPSVELVDPVGAMHDFALDPQLKVPAMIKNGSFSGILAIQRTFLERARKKTQLFPEWAPRVLSEWQRVVDAFESAGGWRNLVGELDWPTKLALFEKVLARNGWTWERVGEINQKIEEAVEPAQAGLLERSRRRQWLFDSAYDEALRLAVHEYGREEIGRFVQLKKQLAALDARYMELGKDSLFEHVAAPLEELDAIAAGLPDDPLELPLPRAGRAKVRAELVREMGWVTEAEKTRDRGIRAHWTSFIAKGKILEMPEVAGVEDRTWRDVPESGHARPPGRRPPGRRSSGTIPECLETVRIACNTAQSGMDSGDYVRAANVLERSISAASSVTVLSNQRVWFWKNVARLYCRQQRADDLRPVLEYLKAIESYRLEWLWESSNAATWLGLAGQSSVSDLADEVRREMAIFENPRPSGIACWKAHLALWLNRQCRPSEAFQLLETTISAGEYDRTSESVKARIVTQFGEAERMIGSHEEAGRRFTLADMICRHADLKASMLDTVLTGQARLLAAQGDRQAASRILIESVLPEQRRRRMPSEVRTIVLLTRLSSAGDSPAKRAKARNALARKARRYSGFASCPRLAKIVDHWDLWCDGEADPDPPEGAEMNDQFWGV